MGAGRSYQWSGVVISVSVKDMQVLKFSLLLDVSESDWQSNSSTH